MEGYFRCSANHFINALIIVNLYNRTYWTCGNNSAGSTGTHHSRNSLVYLLGGLNLFLGKLGIIFHLIDKLHHCGSCSWRRSNHFLLLCNRNHVLFHLEIVNLVIVLYSLNLTLCELKGNEQ